MIRTHTGKEKWRHIYDKTRHIVLQPRVSSRLKLCLFIASFGLLAITTLYMARQANYQHVINSDNLAYPYLVKDFAAHDAIVPGKHSNIFMFPLYYLQSVLPYTYTSVSIVNIGLILLTVAGWMFFVWRIFGKKTALISCLTFSAFLFASSSLATGLLGNTIRNVEYPIFFGYIAVVATLLHISRVHLRSRLGMLALCLSTAMAFVMAGDGLMLFITLFSVVGSVLWRTFHDRKLPAGWKIASAYVFVTFIGYGMMKILAQKSGVVGYYNDVAFQPRIIPYEHISFSISEATKQLIHMHGATIFGLNPIGQVHALYILNFILLIVGVWGLGYALKRRVPMTKKTTTSDLSPTQHTVASCLVFSFIALFTLYILSDQVVQNGPAGTLITSGQARYITLLPFISCVGIALWLNKFRLTSYRHLALIAAVVVVAFLSSFRYIANTHAQSNYSENYHRSTTQRVAQTALEHDVHTLVTGYWYGASVRFWSNDRVRYANVIDCNLPGPTFNMRWSWYKPSPSVTRSGLLVDRVSNDSGSWHCTNDDLIRIYGKPLTVVPITVSPDAPGAPIKNNLGELQLWVYDYDVRQKIKR